MEIPNIDGPIVDFLMKLEVWLTNVLIVQSRFSIVQRHVSERLDIWNDYLRPSHSSSILL